MVDWLETTLAVRKAVMKEPKTAGYLEWKMVARSVKQMVATLAPSMELQSVENLVEKREPLTVEATASRTVGPLVVSRVVMLEKNLVDSLEMQMAGWKERHSAALKGNQKAGQSEGR